MKRNGFTLMELLVVIVVIGILATLVAGAARYAMRAARTKRKDISCGILKTAIHRYRTEYGDWPHPENNKGTARWVDAGSIHKRQVYDFTGADNASVFGMLRATSDDNPDHIRFLDETTFFTPDGDSGASKLCDTTGGKPLVCQYRSGRWTSKSGNKYLYYTVTFDYEYEDVTVSVSGFNDEGADDEDDDEDENHRGDDDEDDRSR